MSWEEQLERASFRGVEFDCLSVSDPVERRVVAHEYPFRDGATLDDLGRKPRSTVFNAVFFGDEYEADLGGLLTVIDDGKTGPLRHPILGTWKAKVTSYEISHDANMRDFASVTITFQEDGLDVETPTLFSVEAALKELEGEVTAYEETYTYLYEIPPPPLLSLLDDVTDFIADVEGFISDINERIHQLNTFATKAIIAARQLGDVKSWPIVRTVRRVTAAAKKVAANMSRIMPRAEKKTVQSITSLRSIATKQYGDGSRVDDMLILNKVRNPFLVPAGFDLKVHEDVK